MVKQALKVAVIKVTRCKRTLRTEGTAGTHSNILDPITQSVGRVDLATHLKRYRKFVISSDGPVTKTLPIMQLLQKILAPLFRDSLYLFIVCIFDPLKLSGNPS